MTEDQRKQAEDQHNQFIARLAPLRRDDPLLLGIAGIAADLSDDAVRESGRLGLSGDDRAFLDGRQSALADFGAYLAAAIAEAQTSPDQASK